MNEMDIGKFVKNNWKGIAVIGLGLSSLVYLGNKSYHDGHDPHVTNIIDEDCDGDYEPAFDTYYKLPARVDENGFTHYELSDRVRKRQLSHEEKEILKEMKERNLRQQHNQPIKNIYNIV